MVSSDVWDPGEFDERKQTQPTQKEKHNKSEHPSERVVFVAGSQSGRGAEWRRCAEIGSRLTRDGI